MGTYLPLTGGTLTGKLHLPENVQDDSVPTLSFGPRNNSGFGFAAVDDIPDWQALMVFLDGWPVATFQTNGPHQFSNQLQLPRDRPNKPGYTFAAMYGSGLYGSEPAEGAEVVGISIKTVSRFEVREDYVTTTVPLLLPADPTTALGAVTKQYVDAAVAAGGGGGVTGDYLPLTGGTLTGALMLTPGTAALPAVTFGVTNTGIHGGSSAIRFATNGANRFLIDVSSITSLVPINLPADPTNLLEAATKQYVDSTRWLAAASSMRRAMACSTAGKTQRGLRSLAAERVEIFSRSPVAR